MKKNKLLLGLSALMAFGLFLGGCGGPSSDPSSSSSLSSSNSSSNKVESSSSNKEEHVHDFELVEEIINDCESDIIEIYVCKGCKEEKKQPSQDYRDHNFGPWEIIEEPTEEKEGLQRHTCDVCGKIEEQKIDVLDHIHHYEVVHTTQPTCEEDGYRYYKCSCGDEYSSVYQRATGHSYGEWTIETYPSFETEGYAYRLCSKDLNHKDELFLPILNENDYKYVVLEAPTCQNPGFVEVTYNKNGIRLETTIIVDPIDHSYSDWKLVENPTFEEGGLIERDCVSCFNAKEEHEIPSLQATAFYNLNIKKEATCTELGFAIVSFKYQEKTFSFETSLPKLEHSYTALPPSYIEATCETPKYIKYTCVCGEYILEEDGLALGHEFHDEWEILSMPSYEERGKVRNYCERNHEHYVDYDLPALNEGSYNVQISRYPSCVVEGISIYTIYIFGTEESKVTFEVVTPKIDHNYEYDVRTYYPTCTEEGTTVFKCHCGESYEEVFAEPLGHEGYFVPSKEPTCEINGYKEHYFCKNCESYFLDSNLVNKVDYETVVIKALDHEFSNWEISSYPTMEYFGRLIRVCERGCVEYRALANLKDKEFYDYELVRSNTCESTGLEIYRYTIDNQVIEIEYIIPALGHSYGEWQKEKDPTFEEKGLLVRVCSIDETHLDYKELPILNDKDYKYEVLETPTCEEEGLGLYSYYFQGVYYEYEVIIPALNHDYTLFEMKEIPTFEESGLLERVCLNDETHVEQIELPLLNKEDYDYELVTKPLCEEKGLETYTFTYEEQEFVIEVILEETGHEAERINLYDESVHYDVCACGGEFNHEEHTFVDEYCSECGVHESIKYLKFVTKNSEPAYYISQAISELTYLVIPKEYKGLPVIAINSESALSPATRLETVVIPKTLNMKYSRAFIKVPSLRNVYFEGTLLDYFNTPIAGNMFSSKELHLFVLDDEGNYYEVIDLVVPSEVKEINAYQFARFSGIKTLTVPSTVTKINSNAFEYCSGLTNVVIEDGVSFIGELTFRDCTSLEEIVLPNTLTSIEGATFQNCSSLKEIAIPDSVLTVYYMAFQDCISLESVEFSNKLQTIGSSAFYNCDSLVSVVIPSSVTMIGNGAFIHCDELLYASILNPDCYVGSNIFYNCNKLQDIKFPISSNLSRFSDVISSDTKTLTNVIVNGGSEVPSSFFRGYKTIRSITLASTITKIGSYAFYDCDGLEGINIPYEVEVIEEFAFYDCDSLEYANIPSSVKTIEKYAFYSCDKLNSVLLNEGIESIGQSSFDGCISLKQIQLPNTLQTIGMLAFYDCRYLERVEISQYSKLKVIENRAFSSCYSLQSIYLPSTLEILEEQVFRWCYGLEEVEFAYGIKLTEISGEVFSCCQSLRTVNLENCIYVTTINQNAFLQNYALKEITIPASVERIEKEAFSNGFNGKLNFEEGSRLKTIGSSAFRSYNQSTLTLPEGLETIESSAFIQLEIESLTIPSTVKLIDSQAFGHVKKVYLSSGVEKFGYIPFNGYRNDEKVDVYYNGTLEQALSIEFDERGVFNSKVTWYFNGRKLTGDIEVDNVSEIHRGVFTNSDITSIKFNSQIITIHAQAFINCKKLNSVDLSNQTQLEKIGAQAFGLCESLNSIYIPNSVLTIGDDAFMHSGLRSLEFEEDSKLEEFNLRIVDHCYYLTSIKIPEGPKDIDLHVLYSPIISITIPSTATSIKGSLCYDRLYQLMEVVNLSSATLPSDFQTVRNIYNEQIANNILVVDNEFVFLKNKDNSYILAAYLDNKKHVELPNDILGEQYEVNPSIFEHHELVSEIFVSDWFPYDSSHFKGYIAPTVTKRNSVYIIDNFLVKDYSGTVRIIDILGNEKDIVLPEQINEKDYFIDSKLFEENKNITSVYIPASVSTSSTYLSFKNATNLVTITIEEGSKIKANYFTGCKSLINIPQKENLHTDTLDFKDCESLRQVELPEGLTSINSSLFENCYSLESVVIPSTVKRVYDKAFLNCSSLQTIELPEGITTIYSQTFSGCTNLRSITIPETVTSIYQYAFEYCKSLTSIIIPSSVTSLGTGVFRGCESLRSITLSENITKINDSTFYGCKSLQTITIPNNVTEINRSAFAYSGITTVNFNENSKLTTLGSNVFEYCDKLTSISLPSGITEVPYRAFYNAKNLVSVSLPEGVTSIGQEAFYNCYMLETINMPASLISIKDSAFYNCYYLKELKITNKETTFGRNAIAYCYHLKTVEMPIELNNISSNVFINCYMLKEITYIEEN